MGRYQTPMTSNFTKLILDLERTYLTAAIITDKNKGTVRFKLKALVNIVFS